MENTVRKQFNTRWFNRKYIFGLFFFAIFLFLFYQFAKVVSPFLNTMFISVVLAMVFFPLNLRIRKRFADRPNTAAGVSVTIVLLLLIVPVFFCLWLLVKESKELLHISTQLIASIPQPGENISPQTFPLWAKISSISDKFNIDVQELLFGNIKRMGEYISLSGTTLVKNIITLVMDLVVLVLTLFLFFRDGEKITAKLIELAPMDLHHKQMIAERLYQTIVAVVRGLLLTAALQGSTAAVGYAIGGVKTPILLGALTALATLIPVGGSALVWLPTGLYVFFMQSQAWGIFVLAWGVLVVVWIDNFFRPLLIGEQARLPVIILFLALLGGLRTYGPSGLLLGPLLVACIFAFIKIYQEEFARPSAQEQPGETKS